MSNITTFNPSRVPAFAKEAGASALAKSLAGGAAQTGKRISVMGGVFRLISDGKEVASIEDSHLDVVIVNAAAKISRTFYAGEFSADAPAAPDCWSAEGDKPDASCKNAQADTCAKCPQNIKGSGQGESRACRFNQRLAVVLSNDLEGGDVMQLTLAATSIFGKEEGDDKRPLQAYARFLAAQNINPEMVVTRMKFDTKAATPKLFFSPMRWLTDDEYAVATAKGQSEEAIKAITMTVSQVDGVNKTSAENKLAGQRPAAPAAAPKAEVVPEAPEEVADTVEEPEKRKAAAKPPVVGTPKGKLASVVSNWDADDEG